MDAGTASEGQGGEGRPPRYFIKSHGDDEDEHSDHSENEEGERGGGRSGSHRRKRRGIVVRTNPPTRQQPTRQQSTRQQPPRQQPTRQHRPPIQRNTQPRDDGIAALLSLAKVASQQVGPRQAATTDSQQDSKNETRSRRRENSSPGAGGGDQGEGYGNGMPSTSSNASSSSSSRELRKKRTRPKPDQGARGQQGHKRERVSNDRSMQMPTPISLPASSSPHHNHRAHVGDTAAPIAVGGGMQGDGTRMTAYQALARPTSNDPKFLQARKQAQAQLLSQSQQSQYAGNYMKLAGPSPYPALGRCARHVSIAYLIYYAQHSQQSSPISNRSRKTSVAEQAAQLQLALDPTLEARKLKERTEWMKISNVFESQDQPQGNFTQAQYNLQQHQVSHNTQGDVASMAAVAAANARNLQAEQPIMRTNIVQANVQPKPTISSTTSSSSSEHSRQQAQQRMPSADEPNIMNHSSSAASSSMRYDHQTRNPNPRGHKEPQQQQQLQQRPQHPQQVFHQQQIAQRQFAQQFHNRQPPSSQHPLARHLCVPSAGRYQRHMILQQQQQQIQHRHQQLRAQSSQRQAQQEVPNSAISFASVSSSSSSSPSVSSSSDHSDQDTQNDEDEDVDNSISPPSTERDTPTEGNQRSSRSHMYATNQQTNSNGSTTRTHGASSSSSTSSSRSRVSGASLNQSTSGGNDSVSYRQNGLVSNGGGNGGNSTSGVHVGMRQPSLFVAGGESSSSVMAAGLERSTGDVGAIVAGEIIT